MENRDAILTFINSNADVWTHGMHGLAHWKRVETIGQFLAAHSEADPEVLRMFAYTHDLGREADEGDDEHGHRSAKIVEELYSRGVISLSEKQYNQLVYACYHHTTTFIETDDVTIQACLDSDRLDLWRAGIIPDPQYLYTEIAKKPETIAWSKTL